MGVSISGSITRSLVRSRHRNVPHAWVSRSRAVQHSIRNGAWYSASEPSLIDQLAIQAHFGSATKPRATHTGSAGTVPKLRCRPNGGTPSLASETLRFSHGKRME